jgi:hypothetical protein
MPKLQKKLQKNLQEAQVIKDDQFQPEIATDAKIERIFVSQRNSNNAEGGICQIQKSQLGGACLNIRVHFCA